MKPRVVLLTRDSAFQRFLANRLWRGQWLAGVVCESGDSAPRQSGRLAAAMRRVLGPHGADLWRHPVRTLRHIRNALRRDAFYGQRAYHDARILQQGYEAFDGGLPITHVANINEPEVSAAIGALRPDLVVVFGTRLVKPETMQRFGCPAINLHWGWSPDYRGEGIVTALALEGPQALGVTVHLLAHGVDDGPVLRRARPLIQPGDNFYAIGLRLTVLGADLIEDVLTQYGAGGGLEGMPQDLTRGENRGSRFMREHPELMPRAYDRLTGVSQ